MGQWVAAGLGYSYILAPRQTRFAAVILSAVAVADLLQMADDALQRRTHEGNGAAPDREER